MKDNTKIIIAWLAVIAFMLLTLSLVAQDSCECSFPYDRLIRDNGAPTESIMMPDETLILSYDETDFYYLHPVTHCVIKQRSYVHPLVAKKLIRKYKRKLEYRDGWYYHEKVKVRVIKESDEHVVEILQLDQITK